MLLVFAARAAAKIIDDCMSSMIREVFANVDICVSQLSAWTKRSSSSNSKY